MTASLQTLMNYSLELTGIVVSIVERHCFYALFSRFYNIQYTSVVFPQVKPFNNENVKTLTRDNLEANDARFPRPTCPPALQQHLSTTTTDSDYLSTIPTETTDFMNNYKVLEGNLIAS